MNAALSTFRGRFDEVRNRIETAARRSGRQPGEVSIIAVTKSVSAAIALGAVEFGLQDLGENRVQEAERKIGAIGHDRVRWHMIGHLQSNKAPRAALLFDRIHSIDDIEVARVVAKRAAEAGRVLPALIQVNSGGESTKHGVSPEELQELLRGTMNLTGIRVDGLMSMAPLGPIDDARRCFAATRALRDDAEQALGIGLPELSMGMSGDFEVAVEEGSTMVRLGTVLFGPRG